MGFFDQYKPDEGPRLDYISEEEKLVVIKNKLPLTFVRAWHTESGGYQGKPAYKVVVEFEGKERGLSFGSGSVTSRDDMIDAMIEYVDIDESARPDDWALPVFTIEKDGQAQILVPA